MSDGISDCIRDFSIYNKFTKKAKTVAIKHLKVINYVSVYTCPTCNILHEDHTLNDKIVTRFKCSHCGQELIIKQLKQEGEK